MRLLSQGYRITLVNIESLQPVPKIIPYFGVQKHLQ
jgi:hypothetical protein